MESTKVDFTGQEVYVGIDVAKKSWKLCILVGDLFHRRFSQEPNTAVLVRYLQRNFPGAHYLCVYEAGYCGFWIYWQLRENGIECLVVNPADVPTNDKERRVKTDPIDAAKLARHLRSHELHSIYIPDQPAQEDRTLVRARAQFVRKQTRCKNQIKSLLSFYGYTFPEETIERYWSRAYIRWLEGLTLECSSGTQALQSLLKELLFLRELIMHMTRQIRVLTHTERYARRVRLLCSVPGISIITGMTLLTELITIDRFRTLDQLASYAGLVPGERSSGEEKHDTGITPRRNPAMRWMLLESAWTAARQDPALMMSLKALSHRMPRCQAIVRIARKLLSRIRYVLKNEQPYVKAVVQSL